MKDDSTISILYDLKNKGLIILLPIIIIMTIGFIRDNYKDKHDECRIYNNNLKSLIASERIISIDSVNMSAQIGYYDQKPIVFLKLDKAFIENAQVGDSVHKFRGENILLIYKGKTRIEVPFAQVPNKNCKSK
jgi:hypothetical protein